MIPYCHVFIMEWHFSNSFSLLSFQCIPGNVAHDLRTPLHAFQSELEVLRESSQGSVTKEALEQFRSMQQLDRIINFMTMTINRSIDFTKASSGLKLKHAIESVNLASTVNWAVGCMNMRSQEEEVPILVSPIPDNIHGRVFTDKQWLMENILCLLSNAKKFTTEGEIRVSCSLQQPSGAADTSSIDPIFLPTSSTVIEDTHIDEAVDLEAPALGPSETELVNKTSPQRILIEVEDTGIGIAEDQRPRLFQAFGQV